MSSLELLTQVVQQIQTTGMPENQMSAFVMSNEDGVELNEWHYGIVEMVINIDTQLNNMHTPMTCNIELPIRALLKETITQSELEGVANSYLPLFTEFKFHEGDLPNHYYSLRNNLIGDYQEYDLDHQNPEQHHLITRLQQCVIQNINKLNIILEDQLHLTLQQKCQSQTNLTVSNP